MELVIDGCILKDIEDKKLVVSDIITKSGHEYFEPNTISRAMAAYKDGDLWGYFLTCSFLGIRSFHGFKFKSGEMLTQMRMSRKYLEIEELNYSAYRTKETKAILKVLGFKETVKIGEYMIMRKY